MERFAAQSLPTEAEEIWRYSRISQLDLDEFSPAAATEAPPGIPAELQPVVAAAGPHSGLLVLRNGQVSYAEVDTGLAGQGFYVGDVADLPEGDDVLGGVAASGTDAFTELNTAFLQGAAVVHVPASMTVDSPVLILHWLDGNGVAAFPRTIVQAGANSQVTVVEHQASSDTRILVDPVIELDVGQAARVRYLNLQDLGPQVWQVGYQASRVGRDATLQSSVVALGGAYARVRTDSVIEGRGGSSYLTALYFADGERMHDFRTVQDHAGPSSTSDLLFKGAVQDHGRSVYSGLIRVRKEAVGTNAFQTNRNLVLSEGASAESVPNLEIETNDVRCSHASAVGPIDEDQRYYLESRGVPPEAAERLIVLGFFSEVLDRLPTPELVASIRAAVAERLHGDEVRV
ncbi:MAG: Fe-S cluster assembly protein SufD [Acidimicrobiales bacterium]|nr:Fe-S cluster assembly protein SufD [Actinomycetota bacterium]